MSKTIRFTAEILIKGINPYVLVSADQALDLKADWRKPMPVLVRVNGKPENAWHINMMPTGSGDFYLYLHNDVRTASQTKLGDTVAIELSFDESYHNGPLHDMPSQFQTLLEQNPSVATNWSNLSPSRQKEILRYLASLKSNEALERNIHKAIYVLTGHKGRFMARDWKDGK
jgi:hypothetical protein